MYTTLARQTQKLVREERLREAAGRSRQTARASWPRHRRHHAALAGTIAALILAVVPGLANAQSLNNVSLASGASSDWLVLDVSGAATWAGAPVIQWYGNVFASNQRWNFVQLPDGNEHIVSQNSGMCLTTDLRAGDQVYQEPCGPYVTEEWEGTLSASSSTGQDGFRTLENPYSRLFLDVSGNSNWAGAAIITWRYDSTNGEYFRYYQR
jgi:Ricin-type beta-trefoil lectin domain-like